MRRAVCAVAIATCWWPERPAGDHHRRPLCAEAAGLRLAARASPRAWIYGRNPNSPELSGGNIPEGDGPAAKGPKDTNVPQFDDPGKPEGPYGGDDLDKKKEAEAPEVEKHGQEHVLQKEGIDKLEGDEVAQQGGIAPGGVLSDKNYLHNLLPMKDGEEPRNEVPFGKDAPLAHPFAKTSPPAPRPWPESDEGPLPVPLKPRPPAPPPMPGSGGPPPPPPSDTASDAADAADEAVDEATDNQAEDDAEKSAEKAGEDAAPDAPPPPPPSGGGGPAPPGGLPLLPSLPTSPSPPGGAPALPQEGGLPPLPSGGVGPNTGGGLGGRSGNDGAVGSPSSPDGADGAPDSSAGAATTTRPTEVGGASEARPAAGTNAEGTPPAGAQPSGIPGKGVGSSGGGGGGGGEGGGNSEESAPSGGDSAGTEAAQAEGAMDDAAVEEAGALVSAVPQHGTGGSVETPATDFYAARSVDLQEPTPPNSTTPCVIHASDCSKPARQLTDQEAVACMGVHRSGLVAPPTESRCSIVDE